MVSGRWPSWRIDYKTMKVKQLFHFMVKAQHDLNWWRIIAWSNVCDTSYVWGPLVRPNINQVTCCWNAEYMDTVSWVGDLVWTGLLHLNGVSISVKNCTFLKLAAMDRDKIIWTEGKLESLKEVYKHFVEERIWKFWSKVISCVFGPIDIPKVILLYHYDVSGPIVGKDKQKQISTIDFQCSNSISLCSYPVDVDE